jgi:hypothetical protein
LSLLAAACDSKQSDLSSVRAEAPAHSDSTLGSARAIFSDTQRLREAQQAFERALVKPIVALELSIYVDRMVLQARDPARPKHVVQYEYRAGHLVGPKPVELRGPGQLDDNLFPLSEADLSSVPGFVHDALREATPDARVSHVVLRRNLPHSFDVRFRAHINGRDAHEPAQADAKGRRIDPS